MSAEHSLSASETESSQKELTKVIFDILILLIRLYVEFITRDLEKKYPQISPNHVSFAGFGIDVSINVCVVLLERSGKSNKSLRLVLSICKLLAISTDVFDGALSRAKAMALKKAIADGQPITTQFHDSEQGLKIDTVLDRFATAIDGITRAIVAYYKHEDLARLYLELGVILGKFLTDPLPSLANAGMKEEGKQDKKEGDTYLGFTGTQIYRRLEHVFAMLFNLPLPFLATGALGIIGNVSQAQKRDAIAADPNYDVTLTTEVRQAAKDSKSLLRVTQWITTAFGVTAIGVLAALAINRSKKE